MAAENQLRVIIVGSGIAGLCASRVLQEKHRVVVYERGGPSTSTGGQGVASTPNAVKILEALGFDRNRSKSAVTCGWKFYNKDGKPITEALTNYEARYGSDGLMHTRKDFRDELLRLAMDPSEKLGIPGEPVEVVWNQAVTKIDHDRASVTLQDGSTSEADVVIVADGIHSKLRNAIINSTDHDRTVRTGTSCFRVLVAAETVKAASAQFPQWWEPNSGQGYAVYFDRHDGTGRSILCYPVACSKKLNISCYFPTLATEQDYQASWNNDGNMYDALKIFQGFNESLLILISAHAMSPLLGQGANMAIEDAEGLRLLLQTTVRRENIYSILKKFELARIQRVTQILKDTRAMGEARTAEERLMRIDSVCRYDGISRDQ